MLTRETALIKTNLVSKHEDDLERNESEQTCKVENGQGKQFLAAGEAYVAIFLSTPGFKGRMFVSSGFST